MVMCGSCADDVRARFLAMLGLRESKMRVSSCTIHAKISMGVNGYRLFCRTRPRTYHACLRMPTHYRTCNSETLSQPSQEILKKQIAPFGLEGSWGG